MRGFFNVVLLAFVVHAQLIDVDNSVSDFLREIQPQSFDELTTNILTTTTLYRITYPFSTKLHEQPVASAQIQHFNLVPSNNVKISRSITSPAHYSPAVTRPSQYTPPPTIPSLYYSPTTSIPTDLVPKDCAAENGLTRTNIMSAITEEHKAIKCYLLCVFKEKDMLNENGEVNLEKLLAILPDPLHQSAVNISRRCINPVGDTECDRAFWIHKCWKNANGMLYAHI